MPKEAGAVLPNSQSTGASDAQPTSKPKLQEEVIQSSRLLMHTTQEENITSQRNKKEGNHGQDYKVKFSRDEESRDEMKQRVRRTIEVEEGVLLHNARQAMQKRVDVVVQVEEQALLSNKRANMSIKVAKQIEQETFTEIAKRERESQIEIKKEQLKPNWKKQLNALQDEIETHIEIQKEQVMQELKIQLEKDAETERPYYTEVHERAEKSGQQAQVQKELHDTGMDPDDTKEQDETLTRSSVLQSRPPSMHLSSNSTSKLQAGEEMQGVPDMKETIQKVKEKLKLEELVLIDDMKEKMLLRVNRTVDALEKSMFKEEHRLAAVRVRDRVEEQLKAMRREVELQMILEKDLLLKEKREEMQARVLKLIENEEIMEMGKVNAMRCKHLQSCQQISHIDVCMHPTRQMQNLKAAMSPTATIKQPHHSPEVQKEARDPNTHMPTCSQESKSGSDEEKSWNDSYKIEVSGTSRDLPTLSGSLAKVEKQMSDLLQHFKQELNEELHKFRYAMEQFSLTRLVDLPVNGSLNEPNSMVPVLNGWRVEVEKAMKEFVQHCQRELVEEIRTSKNKVTEELSSLHMTSQDKHCREPTSVWQEKHMWCTILNDATNQWLRQGRNLTDIELQPLKSETLPQWENDLEKEKRVFCNILNEATEKWLWHQRQMSYSDVRSGFKKMDQEGGQGVQELNHRHSVQREEKMSEMMIEDHAQWDKYHYGGTGSSETLPLTERECQLKSGRCRDLPEYHCHRTESSCKDRSSVSRAAGAERSDKGPSEILEHISMKCKRKSNFSNIDEWISHADSSGVLTCTSAMGEDEEHETDRYPQRLANFGASWNLEDSQLASLCTKSRENLEIHCSNLMGGMKTRIANCQRGLKPLQRIHFFSSLL